MPQHPNMTLAGALADGAHHWQHRRYADMNLAIRWLKAHAAFGGTPRVGALGVSSGGHLVCPGGRQPSLRCGVLRCQIRRCYRLAKQAGNASIVKSHDAYGGSEAAMEEVNPPPILERGGHIGMPLLTPFRRHSKLATTRPKRVRWWIPLRTLSSVTAADK